VLKTLFPTLRHYFNFLLMAIFFMLFVCVDYVNFYGMLDCYDKIDVATLMVLLAFAVFYFYNEWAKPCGKEVK